MMRATKWTITVPNRKLTLSSNTAFALLASVMFCQVALFQYAVDLIEKIPGISILAPFFFPVLYGLLFLLATHPGRYRYCRLTDFGILAFLLLAILLTCLFYEKNYQYIMDMFSTQLLPCVPFFILGLCITTDEKTYNMVSKFSCATIVVNILYFFYYVGSGRVLIGSHGEDYSMYWSYLLLPNILMTIDYAFRSKKAVPIACAVIGIVHSFAMGTRGAIVVIFAFFIVSVWRYLKMRASRKAPLMSVLILLMAGLVLSPVFTQLLVLLRNFLIDIGASTRAVDYLMSGEMISQTSGRILIYENLLSKLSIRPFTGYGIYGEYPFGYIAGAHNIYLEVVFHFGYLVGILLLASYLLVYFKALLASKGSLDKNWIVLFGCLVFIKGIYGGSYLDYTVFFLLGLCLSTIRARNYLKITGIRGSVKAEDNQ